MKTKHALVLVLVLVVLGATLIWGTDPIVLALTTSAHNPETELGELYAEFYNSWAYVSDEEDIWSISPDHVGDCEDFALTFYSEYPREVPAWILVVSTPSNFLERVLGTHKYQGHVLLIIRETDGFYYAVDNGNVGGPFSLYEEAVAFCVEVSGAESAWDWYLPSRESLLSAGDIQLIYVTGYSRILF